MLKSISLTELIAFASLERQRDAGKNRSHKILKLTSDFKKAFFIDQTGNYFGQRLGRHLKPL